jgi:hypothetical protein
MKTRLGFVSNSSSSSFTCDVCGETQGGWDCCLSEVDMFECENGHVICVDEAAISGLSTWLEEHDDDHYEVDPKFCPLCQFEKFSLVDLCEYLMMQYGHTFNELRKQIREQFKDYPDFAQTIRKWNHEEAYK